MPTRLKLMRPFSQWPMEDRHRWEAAFKSGDLFDENGAMPPSVVSALARLSPPLGNLSTIIEEKP
jgi:hypothetical protein